MILTVQNLLILLGINKNNSICVSLCWGNNRLLTLTEMGDAVSFGNQATLRVAVCIKNARRVLQR